MKAATSDTTLPAGSFLFGADSQAATAPSVYPINGVASYGPYIGPYHDTVHPSALGYRDLARFLVDGILWSYG